MMFLCSSFTTEANGVYSHCFVCQYHCCSWAPLSLFLLMLLCFLLHNFLLSLCVFALLLAYAHPTHPSYQPLKFHVDHQYCCFTASQSSSNRLTAGKALQGYSQMLLLLLLLMTRPTCSVVYWCGSIYSVGCVGVTTLTLSGSLELTLHAEFTFPPLSLYGLFPSCLLLFMLCCFFSIFAYIQSFYVNSLDFASWFSDISFRLDFLIFSPIFVLFVLTSAIPFVS